MPVRSGRRSVAILDDYVPELGDKIRFRPAAWCENPDQYVVWQADKEVTGTVIFIHWPHRYYRVEYESAGCIGHECFKF